MLFKLLKIRESDDPLINLGLFLCIGIVILTLLSNFFRLIDFNPQSLWIFPIISIFYFIYKKKKTLTSLISSNFQTISSSTAFILFVILIGTMAQANLLLHGGSTNSKGFVFPQPHDTLWNLSIVAELLHHFPPEHPGFAGVPLRNHHYFYHLFLATTASITHINITDLYFQFGPILVSFLFGLSIYLVAAQFTQRAFFRGLGIFLGYFSGSFAFLTPLIFGSKFNWTANIFLSDQPFDQIINPYTVLGLAIFLIAIYLLFQAQKGGKAMLFWDIIFALVAGSLYGFKSFGGILIMAILAIYSIFMFFISKKFNLLFIFLISLFFFIPVFLLITNLGRVSLNWAPGWLLTIMMADQNRLNLPSFSVKENYYSAIGNHFGFLKLKIIELLVYFLGNLGIRLIGFIYIFRLAARALSAGNIKNHSLVLFVLFSIILAISIPLLFNLSLNSYDIIQFTPYSLVLLALTTALAAEKTYQDMVKRKHQLLGISFLIGLVLFSIPGTIQKFLESIPQPSQAVSFAEVTALNYIKENSNDNAVILINPSYFPDPMYIAAFSERRLYLGDPSFADHTGINPQQRLNEVKKFFNGEADDRFLNNNHITFIYTPRKLSGGINYKNISPVYENETILVYKLKSNNEN